VRIVRSFVVLRPVGSRGTTVVDDPFVPTTAGSLAFQDHGRSDQGRGRHLGRGVCVSDRTQVSLPLDYLRMFRPRSDRSYIPRIPNRTPRHLPYPLLVRVFHRNRTRLRHPRDDRVRAGQDDVGGRFPYLESEERLGSDRHWGGGDDPYGVKVSRGCCEIVGDGRRLI
jgi:hypothetical protein